MRKRLVGTKSKFDQNKTNIRTDEIFLDGIKSKLDTNRPEIDEN
jgi:hypothetical protein